jgi:hypothetical protein
MCIFFYVIAVFINKVEPLFYLPSLLLLISIMVNPIWSLVFNSFLIALEIFTLYGSAVEIRQAIRMVVDSITLVLILQLVVRERSTLGTKTATVIDKLRELSARLSVNLTEITRQRNDAMTKDFQTGFLTGHSLKTELAEYLQKNANEKNCTL